MWLNEIFAREFGTSDVQSNYSRVYAWMANQLGHMTLGLATALFFAWIADTVRSAAAHLTGAAPWPTAAAENCDMAIACAANNTLLVLLSAGVVIAMIYVGVEAMRDRSPPPPTAKVCAATGVGGPRYRPMAAKVRRAAGFVFVGLMLIALTYLFYKAATAFGVAPEGETMSPQDRQLDLLAAAAGCFAVAAGVLLLCRDLRYFIFAILSLFGAFWIAAQGAGAGQEAAKAIAVALALLFGLYAIWSTALSRDAPERLDPVEKAVQVGVIVVMSAWFISGTWYGLDEDWPLAIAAAIASCTLWWIKEFASDLPKVYGEIALAAARRPVGVFGDCDQIDEDYVSDARMDARTDALFYFAGAWIGAGVLSDTPVFTNASWESGSELVGLCVFVSIFVLVGRNWAFRQQALDLSGVDQASRLAVFRAALRLSAPSAGDGDGGGGGEPVDNVMQALRAFAHGETGAEGTPGFDHLLIFGAHGSGRSPLGRALASEAALSDYPTLMAQISRRKEAPRRTSRFITADRLRHVMRDIDDVEDIAATPPLQLKIDGDRVFRAAADAPQEPDRAYRGNAAHFVVIDGVKLPKGGDAEALKAALAPLIARLAIPQGQETVWLIEDDRFERDQAEDAPGAGRDHDIRDGADADQGADDEGGATQEEIDGWVPDPARVAPEVAAFREALTHGAGAPRIAVGFTRRFQPSASPD